MIRSVGESMEEKVIGILGGMGPEATLDCFRKILRYTPASKDQDHLRVIIDSNPKVPDRTAAIMGEGPTPVPALVEGAEALKRAGADFLIIPCVSAHFFLEELVQRIDIPVLSIFDAVAEAVVAEHPEIRTLGLLATTGTIEGGIFQRRLREEGIETLVCRQDHQCRVMEAIYDLKKSPPGRPHKAIRADLLAAAEDLIEAGAQGIVAGCTEIPLALGPKDLAVPYFDVLSVLAKAAVRRAGKEPLPDLPIGAKSLEHGKESMEQRDRQRRKEDEIDS